MKKPWLAVLLNIFLPGVGFIYVGTVGWIVGGIILIVVTLVGKFTPVVWPITGAGIPQISGWFVLALFTTLFCVYGVRRRNRRVREQKCLDILLECKTVKQTVEALGKIARILKEEHDSMAEFLESQLRGLSELGEAELLKQRDAPISGLRHGLRLPEAVRQHLGSLCELCEAELLKKRDALISGLPQGILPPEVKRDLKVRDKTEAQWRQNQQKYLDILLKCKTAEQTTEGFHKIARILKEEAEFFLKDLPELSELSEAELLKERDDCISGLRHSLRLPGEVWQEAEAFFSTEEPVEVVHDPMFVKHALDEGKIDPSLIVCCPHCGAAYVELELRAPLRNKFAQIVAKLAEPEERDWWLDGSWPKNVICVTCKKQFSVTFFGRPTLADVLGRDQKEGGG